jgi:uncharacterized membrane protein YdjX (TVP38/TMEM64 family)
MKEAVLQFFQQHPDLALVASLTISILIAVLGLVPSFFVTAANLLFFGFWPGIFVSFGGEALGAVVAFYLYRKGFKKEAAPTLEKHKRIKSLSEAKGWQAFWLIFSLRLIPFVPSGVVTFAAAIGRVSLFTFLFSSSLGKLPALLLEGYAVYQVTELNWQGKVILTITAIVLLFFVLRRIYRKKSVAGAKE